MIPPFILIMLSNHSFPQQRIQHQTQNRKNHVTLLHPKKTTQPYNITDASRSTWADSTGSSIVSISSSCIEHNQSRDVLAYWCDQCIQTASSSSWEASHGVLEPADMLRLTSNEARVPANGVEVLLFGKQNADHPTPPAIPDDPTCRSLSSPSYS